MIHLTHGIQPSGGRAGGARAGGGDRRTCRSACTWRWSTRGWARSGGRSRCARADGRALRRPGQRPAGPAAEACGGIAEAVQIETGGVHAATGVAHVPRPRRVRAGGRRTWRPASRSGGARSRDRHCRPGSPAAAGTPARRHRAAAWRSSTSTGTATFSWPCRRWSWASLFRPGRLVELAAEDDRYYVECADTFADVGERRARALRGLDGAALGRDQPGQCGRADGRRGAGTSCGSSLPRGSTRGRLDRRPNSCFDSR